MDTSRVAPVVDLHNHAVPEMVVEFLEREGNHYDTRIVRRGDDRLFQIGHSTYRPIHERITCAGARVPDMDAAGTDVQAVSCVPFVMYPDVSPDLGLEIARVSNDALADFATTDPMHFVALGSVPLQDPGLAARELERVVALGLRGVEIPPQVLGRGLDEKEFDPFFETAAALRVPVCIHPFEASPSGSLARYGLSPLVGGPCDTGLAAALLIFGGVFERHPNLRIVLYHGGGVLPWLLGRLDKGHEVLPMARKAIPRPPSSYLDQLWFDTLVLREEALRFLVTALGAERLVLGSDYPLPLGPASPAAEVRALELEPEQEHAILGGNACRLLSLKPHMEVA